MGGVDFLVEKFILLIYIHLTFINNLLITSLWIKQNT